MNFNIELEQKFPTPDQFNVISAKSYKNDQGKNIPGPVTPYLHCYTAGKITERILKSDITPKSALIWLKKFISLSILAFITSIHDIGKISPGFQSLIRGRTENFDDMKYGLTKHEIISYLYTKPIIGDLSKCLLYHHGFYRGENNRYTYKHINDGWDGKRKKTFEKLLDNFNISNSDINNIKQIKLEKNLIYFKYITSIICISDWLASDEKFFPTTGYNLSDVPNIIEKMIKELKLFLIDYSKTSEKSFQEIFSKNEKIFKPYSIQKSMIENIKGPGIYILEDSTGGGKTEGALFPSLKLCKETIANGLYFALPTQITSNNIFNRVNDAIFNWFNINDTHLIHSNSDIMSTDKKNSWFKGNKRALLDDFATGTIDQILLSVIPKSKFFFIRTLGLYNKVVILDEVHSYDYYTSGIIIQLVKELIEMDCIIIILSATLTKEFKQELLNAAS